LPAGGASTGRHYAEEERDDEDTDTADHRGSSADDRRVDFDAGTGQRPSSSGDDARGMKAEQPCAHGIDEQRRRETSQGNGHIRKALAYRCWASKSLSAYRGRFGRVARSKPAPMPTARYVHRAALDEGVPWINVSSGACCMRFASAPCEASAESSLWIVSKTRGAPIARKSVVNGQPGRKVPTS
jgi:hypothetical protein